MHTNSLHSTVDNSFHDEMKCGSIYLPDKVKNGHRFCGHIRLIRRHRRLLKGQRKKKTNKHKLGFRRLIIKLSYYPQMTFEMLL